MATLNIIEQTKVSPPANSVPNTSLPLTFLDIPWLLFSPSKPLFLYQYPFSTSHFLHTTLPILKHSLSLTLQHFFPFAGTLPDVWIEFRADTPRIYKNFKNRPDIVYTQNDYLTLTVAESSEDFSYLVSDYPRDVNAFYNLVPRLDSDTLSVQLTVFPNSGICVGFSYHHVVADLRTFNNFVKAWASICSGSEITSLPFFNRMVIKDPRGLEEVFLDEIRKRYSRYCCSGLRRPNVDLSNVVRATFMVKSKDMSSIKKSIVSQCEKMNRTQPVHLSPYVLACAFIWVNYVKAQQTINGKIYEDRVYFAFIAGGMTRFDFQVPASYFGNCVGFGRCAASRKQLVGEDGLIVAASEIGSKIKKLDKEILDGAERWISDWEEVLRLGGDHIVVSGSPKSNFYETDFGWGKPKKIEEVSIDLTKGISLMDSRRLDGGIEVGLALPEATMEAFSFMFNEGLKSMVQ